MILIKKQETIEDLEYINNELADGMYIDSNGDIYWYKNGKLHNENDKPAIIQNDGYKLWFKKGKQYYLDKE
jgi:hypothetical protein